MELEFLEYSLDQPMIAIKSGEKKGYKIKTLNVVANALLPTKEFEILMTRIGYMFRESYIWMLKSPCSMLCYIHKLPMSGRKKLKMEGNYQPIISLPKQNPNI